MPTHRRTITALLSRRNMQVLSLGIVAVIGSFSLGIQSAGELKPIALIEAGSADIRGDVDGSGDLTIQDAITILEIAEGYRSALPEQLRSDPNGDGRLTVDDAIRILADLSLL